MNLKATFRRHERVLNPRDFRRAYERRRSQSDDVLVIYGAENGCPRARLGISISRRKVRAAFARNRLKRLIREAFRLSKANLPPGIDLIVQPRRQNLSLAEVRESLVALAGQIARKLNGSRP